MKLKLSEFKAILKETLTPYLQNPKSRAVLRKILEAKMKDIKTSKISKTIDEVLDEVISSADYEYKPIEKVKRPISIIGKDGKIHVWPHPSEMAPETKKKFKEEMGVDPDKFIDKTKLKKEAREREFGYMPMRTEDGSILIYGPNGMGLWPHPSKMTSEIRKLFEKVVGKEPEEFLGLNKEKREVELKEGVYGFGYRLVDKKTGFSIPFIEERDQVSLAQHLGWKGKYISEAIKFLEKNLNKTFKDPGYFVTEKIKTKKR
jgi:hypothetical protein